MALHGCRIDVRRPDQAPDHHRLARSCTGRDQQRWPTATFFDLHQAGRKLRCRTGARKIDYGRLGDAAHRFLFFRGEAQPNGVHYDLDVPFDPDSHQVTRTLIAGVEFGQLTVIALAFLATIWLRDPDRYRRIAVVPGSLCIAAMGLYWMAQRIFLQ